METPVLAVRTVITGDTASEHDQGGVERGGDDVDQAGPGLDADRCGGARSRQLQVILDHKVCSYHDLGGMLRHALPTVPGPQRGHYHFCGVLAHPTAGRGIGREELTDPADFTATSPTWFPSSVCRAAGGWWPWYVSELMLLLHAVQQPRLVALGVRAGAMAGRTRCTVAAGDCFVRCLGLPWA